MRFNIVNKELSEYERLDNRRRLENQFIGNFIPDFRELDIYDIADEIKIENDNVSKPFFLILLYNDMGCNICLDRDVSLMVDLFEENPVFIDFIGITHTYNISYIRRFRRINRVNFPLYQDKTNSLSEHLQLDFSPAFFLVCSTTRKIIYTYFPDPGSDDRSVEFFDLIRKFNENI